MLALELTKRLPSIFAVAPPMYMFPPIPTPPVTVSAPVVLLVAAVLVVILVLPDTVNVCLLVALPTFTIPVVLILPANKPVNMFALAVTKVLFVPDVSVVVPNLIVNPDSHKSLHRCVSEPKS